MHSTRLAAALFLLIVALGCDYLRGSDDVVGPPPGAITLATEPILTVPQTFFSGIRDRRRFVIRSRAEWEAFWAELTSNQLPPPPAPEIDFGSRMVIAASMGGRSTCGYSIAVEQAWWSEGRVTTVVLESSPGSSCLVCQAVTAPAAAVIVERRDGPVTFIERSRTTRC
jgi:hypothetical protein